MQLTEKWLGDIGGWQALKTAKEYCRLGAVTEFTQEGDLLRGLVGQGPRKYRASLRTNNPRFPETKCSCPEAQRGLICPHVVAVGLAALGLVQPAPVRQSPMVPASGIGSGPERTPAQKASAPPPVKIPLGAFEVLLKTDDLGKLDAAGSMAVFLRHLKELPETDLPLSQWLYAQGLPLQTHGFRLKAAECTSLLEALSGHERVFQSNNGKDKAAKILINSELKLNIRFQRNSGSSDIQYLLNKEAASFHPSIRAIAASYVSNVKISLLPKDLLPELASFVTELLQKSRSVRDIRWSVQNISGLRELASAESELPPLKILPIEPTFLLRMEGSFRQLSAALQAQVGKHRFFPLSTDQGLFPIVDDQDSNLFYTRNILMEQAAVARLQRAGFSESASGGYEIRGETQVLHFLSSDLDKLKQRFKIEETDSWRHLSKQLIAIKPRIHVDNHDVNTSGSSTGNDWLSLEVAYEGADGFRISRQEVLRLIRSGKRDFKGRDGQRYVLDVEGCEEMEETLRDVSGRFEGGAQGQRLSVPTRQAEALTDFVTDPQALLKHELSTRPESEITTELSDLGKLLRTYQTTGVQWLDRLARMGAGGLLADEMGLGKTVQTLALLRLRRQATPAAERRPALVICPTSLLGNWYDEAQKFVPEMKLHLSHDVERKSYFAHLSDFDLIFTSYALIVRDLKHYKAHAFSTIVLDEASYIRNPDTETARAVCQLRASTRFALTGTPVENSVRDLWSIFRFAAPGCLPAQDIFHERFVKPLSSTAQDRPAAAPVMERLRRLVKPYVLRRTKREVAKDLPEKIEKVLYCSLTPIQQEVYQRLLDEGREEIREARRRSSKGAARMTMFTVLLRLRQVCNDLRLLKSGSKDLQGGGKWPLMEETFTELVEGGHKTLIFSQFVGMLHLLRDKMTEQKHLFNYLDGSSQDRREQVASFQREEDRLFFLISLKAGGYGLNLTAADSVILVDPWWNPAVEAQAIDRAHRIGQGRPVTAYRMITRGTVEEKILRLQSQKRAIMDMAFEEDSAQMTGLSDDDLEEMLA